MTVPAKESRIVACPGCAKKNRVPASATGVPRCGSCGAALPWVAEADDASFAAVAESATVPVLLDLWAPWCGPCHMVTPALEQLARDYAGKVKLVKVNVDRAPALARRFDARSIPTLVLMNGGQTLARQVGAVPEPALRSWLDGALPTRA